MARHVLLMATAWELVVLAWATPLTLGWVMVTQTAPASAKSFSSGAAKRLVKALVKLLFFCVKLMAILLLLASRISLPWESANRLALQLGSESATSSLGDANSFSYAASVSALRKFS